MSNTLALMDLLFPPIRQRALAVLLLAPKASVHLRDLARQAGTHAGTLARELDKLTQTGLVRRTEQGNQVRYQAETGHPLFAELASMFRKTHGVVPALQAALAPLGKKVALAFVFGSVARGTQMPGSDVDLLVLGSASFGAVVQALFPLHQALGREVNPVVYTMAEFAKRIVQHDAFASDLMAKPRLWVKGGDDDLAELVGHPAAAGPGA